MREAARQALERVEALHLAGKTLNEMSTGEARRVLIARALVNRPRALVLDEPTTGLDVVARHRFLESVRRLAREGTTVILITHHVEEIIPEIERVVLLDRGRVAAAGAKEDMLSPVLLSEIFGAPVAVSRANGYFTRTRRFLTRRRGAGFLPRTVASGLKTRRRVQGRTDLDYRTAESVQDQRNGLVHLCKPRP